MSPDDTETKQVDVKNISRAAQSVDGCGMLAAGEIGTADDTDHTQALIDAGLLLKMPAEKAKTTAQKGKE